MVEVPTFSNEIMWKTVEKPSISFSNSGRTASGVTSRPVKPVPPVVMTTSTAASAIQAVHLGPDLRHVVLDDGPLRQLVPGAGDHLAPGCRRTCRRPSARVSDTVSTAMRTGMKGRVSSSFGMGGPFSWDRAIVSGWRSRSSPAGLALLRPCGVGTASRLARKSAPPVLVAGIVVVARQRHRAPAAPARTARCGDASRA